MQYFSITTTTIIAGIFTFLLLGAFLLKHKYQNHIVPTTLFWHEAIKNIQKSYLWGKFSNLLYFILILLAIIFSCSSLLNYNKEIQQNENIIVFDNGNLKLTDIKTQELLLSEIKNILKEYHNNSKIIITQPYPQLVNFRNGKIDIINLKFKNCSEQTAIENLRDAVSITKKYNNKKNNIFVIASELNFKQLNNIENINLLKLKNNNYEFKVLNYFFDSDKNLNLNYYAQSFTKNNSITVQIINKKDSKVIASDKIFLANNIKNSLFDKKIALNIKKLNDLELKFLNSNNEILSSENLKNNKIQKIYYSKETKLPKVVKILFSSIERLKLQPITKNMNLSKTENMIISRSNFKIRPQNKHLILLTDNISKDYKSLVRCKNKTLVAHNKASNILILNDKLLHELATDNQQILLSQEILNSVIDNVKHFVNKSMKNSKSSSLMPLLQRDIKICSKKMLKKTASINYNLILVIIVLVIMCCDSILQLKGKVN